MKININYVSRKWYDITNISSWFWYYKQYTHIKGLNIRIFGVHINIREKNATEKLIVRWRQRGRTQPK
jgi:hypothetical protein